MAIGNIGLTSALSSIAQEQLKQKLQDQQATQEANRLAQALQFHRDQMAMQEQQKGLDWAQEQARLQSAKDIAQMGYDKALALQGMKNQTAEDIATKKIASRQAGLDPEYNNLIKLQTLWKNKGDATLKSAQAQEELLAAIRSGNVPKDEAAALLKNPYWAFGPDAEKHKQFQAEMDKYLALDNIANNSAPQTNAGGAPLAGGVPAAEGDTPTVEDFKGLPSGKALQDSSGGVWVLKNGVPTKVR